MEAAPIAPDYEAVAKRPGPKRRLKSLADLDRRTSAARAAYALRDEIISDLGGAENLSAMQRALVDHVATLAAALSDMAAKYLAGEDTSMVVYATLANAQRRLLADLGLERKAVDVSQSLANYIASRRYEPDSNAEEPEPSEAR